MTAVLTQRFCAVCGATTTADTQRFCPHCGANIYIVDDTKTLKYRPAKEDQVQESDATIRLSSPQKLYLKALLEQAVQESVKPILHEALPEKQRTRQRVANKLSQNTRLVKVGCGIGLVLILAALLFGVMRQNNDPVAQRQANQSKAQLDTLLQQARAIGVPAVSLQSIITQEMQARDSYTPFVLVSRVSATGYYRNLTQRYHALSSQVHETITSITQQYQVQAQQDMQSFQTALSAGSTHNVGKNQSFSEQFSQDQFLLSSAQTPNDYAAISKSVRQSLQVLSLMTATYTKLMDFHDTLTRMSDAHLDVTAMQSQYDNDVQLFDNALQADDFKNLNTQIDVQYQQTVVSSIQAFPYVSITKLNELQTQIHLLQIYGVNANIYQQRLNADQLAVVHAKTVYDQLGFFKQIDGDIASLHGDLVQGNAHYLVKQFHQEVDSWAKAHPFNDAYDGHVYALDNGYMNAGIGAGLDSDLASTDTTAGFEAVIAETNNALFNLHLFEKDYNDKTPYNQIHGTDKQALSHYNLAKKQVLVVSLVEQVMRVYQNGTLVNSYHVTTGRQELPSLPGVWSVLDRRSPVIFTAGEPKSSPFWFPDTPISYAILYHFGGYFVHDAPWRADFGPGTQFPHQDASGTTAYNFDGSHGCVNLQESDANWLYKHTGWDTSIVIY
ncbi:MAG: hypothetical protein PVS3B3_11480 [Ktedonobacteraceae bacterium]